MKIANFSIPWMTNESLVFNPVQKYKVSAKLGTVYLFEAVYYTPVLPILNMHTHTVTNYDVGKGKTLPNY